MQVIIRFAMAAVLLAVGPMVLNGVAFAQQAEPSNEQNGVQGQLELSPVQVIAPTPAPETKRQSLQYPTTGISREQFEALPNQHLGDVLQRLPGVRIGHHPGQRNDVNLRGLDKAFTRTQFDGVTLPSDGEKREFRLNRFPSFLIGEVNVIRNPTAEFEADGIAGQIDVKLRDIPRERKIEIETGAGGGSGLSFGGDRSFKGAYGERFGNFGVQMGLSLLDNPIFTHYRQQKHDGASESAGAKAEKRFKDFLGDFAWFGERNTIHVKPIFLDLNSRRKKTKRAFKADGDLDKTELDTSDGKRRTVAVTVDHTFEGASGFMTATKFAFARSTRDRDRVKTFLRDDGDLDKREDEREKKKDETFELGSKVTLPFQMGLSNELKFGGVFRRRDRFRNKIKLKIEGGVSEDTTGPQDSYSLEEYFFAGFVQDTIGVTDKLSVTPGLRFEHMIRKPTSGASVSSRATISDVLPSFHAVYRPNDRTVLRTSASWQVNRPQFDELAPYRNEKAEEIIEGNPGLKPARAWSFDVGGDYASKNLFFGVNLFHRQIRDVIEKVDTDIDVDGKDLLRFENVGDGFVQGIEFEQRVGLATLGAPALENVSVRANQTLIRSELKGKDGLTQPFPEQPKVLANASLVYERLASGTIISLSGNYIPDISKGYALENKRVTTEKQFRLDSYAETRVYKNVSVFGWVNNITGEVRRRITIKDAAPTIDNEDAGRAFFGGLKARF